MRPTLHVIAVLIVGFCAAMNPTSARASEPMAPLAEEDVTSANIKSYLDAAFMKAEIDKDGDVMVDDSGLKAYIRVKKDQKVIYYYALFKMKAGVSEAKKLQLVNVMNNEVIIVRFCVTNPTRLWCDYYLPYDGPVTPFEIVNAYKRFATVVRQTIATKDPENIVGSD